MNNEAHSQSRSTSVMVTLILIGVVIALAALPLILNPEAKFEGADGAATETISEIVPGVEPWFKPVWEPPSGETESLLFSLQAALGAGIIGYFFGLKRGQRSDLNGKA
jgi:cobalt/nickel transport protein